MAHGSLSCLAFVDLLKSCAVDAIPQLAPFLANGNITVFRIAWWVEQTGALVAGSVWTKPPPPSLLDSLSSGCFTRQMKTSQPSFQISHLPCIPLRRADVPDLPAEEVPGVRGDQAEIQIEVDRAPEEDPQRAQGPSFFFFSLGFEDCQLVSPSLSRRFFPPLLTRPLLSPRPPPPQPRRRRPARTTSPSRCRRWSASATSSMRRWRTRSGEASFIRPAPLLPCCCVAILLRAACSFVQLW